MTMKPNWASEMLLLRGLNVLVTLSVCGPGIDERDDRILARRIEVERLVHHAVEIRDPVVGLHHERLGELEADVDQAR